MVALGDVIRLDLAQEAIEPQLRYRIAGVFGFGRGLFEREEITGNQTSYGTLNRLSVDQLVMSRLKAFEGAVAVVTSEHAGAFVSAEFPTFSCLERIAPEYLAHVCRWPDFWEALASSSKGVGARRERVHVDDLLETRVPLPDIPEQRRVVAHLDLVSQRSASHLNAHDIAAERDRALPYSLARQPQLTDEQRRKAGWKPRPLGEVMRRETRTVAVESTASYPNVGILSFGRGVFEKPPVEGAATSAKTFNRVRAGQFIYSRLFAFEGAYASVPARFDDFFVSNEFPTFDVDETEALAPYIAAALRSPSVWEELAGSSKGLGLRRQRIQPAALLDYTMWLPPIEEQHRIVVGLAKVENLTRLRTCATTMAKALMPSALNRAFAGMA
jgi:type I restriction enzyme S subunit